MTAHRSVLALALLAGCATDDGTVLVFSAASTGDVVAQVAEAEQAAGRPTVVSVAASSVLAQQIAHGAPADVFVSADPAWIDWLIAEGAPVSARRTVAEGRLVLVGPPAAPSHATLADALAGVGRVALADPSHVPAGRYAREALEAAGLWEGLAPRLVLLGDVRAALAAVETGAADRAVVYASDAAASPRVRVLAALEHAPVRFEAALIDSLRGRPLFEALTAPTSQRRWAEAGFEAASR